MYSNSEPETFQTKKQLIERLVGQGVEGMGTTKEKIKYENEQTHKQGIKNGEERREVQMRKMRTHGDYR